MTEGGLPGGLLQTLDQYYDVLRRVQVQYKDRRGKWVTIRGARRFGEDGPRETVESIASWMIGKARAHVEENGAEAGFRSRLHIWDPKKGQERPVHPSRGWDAVFDEDGEPIFSDGEEESSGDGVAQALVSMHEQLVSSHERYQGIIDSVREKSFDRETKALDLASKTLIEATGKVGELAKSMADVGQGAASAITASVEIATVGIQMQSEAGEGKAVVIQAQAQADMDKTKLQGGLKVLEKVAGPLGLQLAKTLANRRALKAAKKKAESEGEAPEGAPSSEEANREPDPVTITQLEEARAQIDGSLDRGRAFLDMTEGEDREKLRKLVGSEIFDELVEANEDMASYKAGCRFVNRLESERQSGDAGAKRVAERISMIENLLGQDRLQKFADWMPTIVPEELSDDAE